MPSAPVAPGKRSPPPWVLGALGGFLLGLLLVAFLLPPGWWTKMMVVIGASVALACGLIWAKIAGQAETHDDEAPLAPPPPASSRSGVSPAAGTPAAGTPAAGSSPAVAVGSASTPGSKPAASAPSSARQPTPSPTTPNPVGSTTKTSTTGPSSGRIAKLTSTELAASTIPPWQEVVARLPYCLVLVDRQGMVRYLNRPLPTSATIAPGQSCYTLFEGHDQAALRRAVAQIQPGAPAVHLEANPLPAGGLDRWLAVDVVALQGIPERPGDVLLVVQDETAAHVQDATVRHSQRMEAIGRLAAGVGHDFNNLLTVVQCNALLLLEALPESEIARVELEEIIEVVKRATKLTHQLLTFSRKQEVHARELDLNEVSRNLLNLLKRLVGEDIELAFEPAAAAVKVSVDDGQMEQVIMNLVVNARDAMPKGGRILITTSHQTFSKDYAHAHGVIAPGTYAVIRISDTGEGIAPGNIGRIFEPYFTTKNEGQGYGLGLSTTYGIIKNHGGGIACSSQPHVGTTFTIYLPDLTMAPATPAPAAPVGSAPAAAAPAAPTPAATPSATPARFRVAPPTPPGPPLAAAKHTILVVEDEPSVREVVRKILSRKGYNLLVAGDAAEARKLCKEHEGPIDLLFSDVVIPDFTGPELAQEIAVLRPDIQVLFTSGYTDSVTLRHGLKTHSVHFLQKPYTATEMANRIAQILG